ncbi:MAG: cysteine desulfurase [Deferribacteraceae bacterium]|jgi:cysteine desulfurase|nr:cysteine desulfurase [Deferribacteraceae bacterium]
MTEFIYFDNSATTRVDPRVAEAIAPFFTEKYGNPSSIHRIGLVAHAELERCRESVANLINCAPREIIFMASGSEADNFALIQTARLLKSKGKHIITTSVEHKAILSTCEFLEGEGYSFTYLPVNSKGNVSVKSVKAAIRPDTILISVMFANNEVGTIMPIKEIAKLAKDNGILMHTDAVQAVGKIKIDVDELGVDMLTLSGHKIYAPKGIGVLFVKEELKSQLSPLIHGGGQESGFRAGTENMPYIAGLAKAAELIMADFDGEVAHIKGLRDRFEQKILENIPETYVNGNIDNRVCSISDITFKYIEAEAVIGYVPAVCCSLGSACTSGQDAASHVLTAMKVDPIDIRGTIRFSFGRFNTTEEVDRAVELLKVGVEKLRQMSPIYNKAF